MTTNKINSSRLQKVKYITANIGLLLVICSVHILITGCSKAAKESAKDDSTATEIKITLRDYLFSGVSEQPHYGLYSYLLFSRKAITAKERDRYIALHQAYRTLNSMVGFKSIAMDSLIKLENINITYWPLRIEPVDSSAKDSLVNPSSSDSFFIINYDYLRADLILKRIRRIKTPGPFIISYHYPLTKLPEEFEKDELLIIDLTRVDQSQFVTVLDYFQRKVLDDSQTWHNKFDWELIRIHVYSALTLHGEPILFAAKWVGDFFDVKKAIAKP